MEFFALEEKTRNPKKLQRRACQAGNHTPNLYSTAPNELPDPMSELLEEDELNTALKRCPEWEAEKKYIFRMFEFEEFMDGIDFVNSVSEIAEEAQHHPDISIKHTKVTLKLTTHDVGGVTDLDIELAQRVDNLVD